MSTQEPGNRAVNLPREIRTARLLLRRWTAADHEPFAALNTDPRVIEFLSQPLIRAESDTIIERIEKHFDEHGFGYWAVEAPGVAAFIGTVGLAVPRFTAYFTPCVEVGWRLAADYWHRGYASEAAQAALDFGFNQLGLAEIVAFTVPANQRSRHVMQRLGMQHDAAGDFDHPFLPTGHWLRRHMLYRKRRDAHE
jgi:RimJ/RimL family protein N-acetyltransferase